MKKGILILLLLASAFVNAQSLKEALYSGKLKNEPGTVIRKGDDLRSKLDTVARREPARDTLAVITVGSPADSIQKKATAQTAAPVSSTSAGSPTNGNTSTETAAAGDTVVAVASEPVAATKDNKAIWKEYMNTLTEVLKSEVLSSKKVKKGSYLVMVSYAIGTDGQVTVTDIFVDPENEFLKQQVKDRIAVEAPKLKPELNSAGAPRKVNKKYNFTLVKE